MKKIDSFEELVRQILRLDSHGDIEICVSGYAEYSPDMEAKIRAILEGPKA